MRSSHHDDANVEPAAVLLRERFESAVGTLELDVASLVSAGATSGAQTRRRRRLAQTAAAFVAVVAVTAGSVVAVQAITEHRRTGGEIDRLEENVSTTPQALAAVLLRHVPAGAQVLQIGGSQSAAGEIRARITMSIGHSTVRLEVAATPEHYPIGCPQAQGSAGCPHTVRLADGRAGDLSTSITPSYPEHQTDADLEIVGRGISVREVATRTSGVNQLPIRVGALLRLGYDPLVGIRTTSAMVTAGERVHPFIYLNPRESLGGH